MRAVAVGIVSIGDMGLGMARLLKAHGYRVITVGEGRRYEKLPFMPLDIYCHTMRNKIKPKPLITASLL